MINQKKKSKQILKIYILQLEQNSVFHFFINCHIWPGINSYQLFWTEKLIQLI